MSRYSAIVLLIGFSTNPISRNASESPRKKAVISPKKIGWLAIDSSPVSRDTVACTELPEDATDDAAAGESFLYAE